jgi:7-cyano-7-deazaguanine synthase
MSTTSVVVLSGGLDSTVALWSTLFHTSLHNSAERVIAVTVDYGQRHLREIGAAQAIVDWYRLHTPKWVKSNEQPKSPLEHVIIAAPSLGQALPGSALTDRRTAVPHGHYAAPSMVSTVVPNRNMIIASMAAGVAVAHDADRLVLGVHAGDHPIYPDCRPEFVEALQTCIRVGTGTDLYVIAPFIDMPKQKIVEIGTTLGAPMELTWSCYQGGNKHCGKCGTCVERREAFNLAGVTDPTEYEE